MSRTESQKRESRARCKSHCKSETGFVNCCNKKKYTVTQLKEHWTDWNWFSFHYYVETQLWAIRWLKRFCLNLTKIPLSGQSITLFKESVQNCFIFSCGTAGHFLYSCWSGPSPRSMAINCRDATDITIYKIFTQELEVRSLVIL